MDSQITNVVPLNINVDLVCGVTGLVSHQPLNKLQALFALTSIGALPNHHLSLKAFFVNRIKANKDVHSYTFTYLS